MNYKLLTPGPLTTTQSVKEAMLFDSCTWDEDYKSITREINQQLLQLAHVNADKYASILMQGSGSFGVESVLSTVIKDDDKVLFCINGAYGKRMVEMAKRYHLNYTIYQEDEANIIDAAKIETILKEDERINTIAMVHSETTSGILNDLESVAKLVEKYDLNFIVDAMSSFGGIDIDVEKLHIDYLISSANKCIQGVPGFSFVIANKAKLESSKNNARTLSLDLYDQYASMNVDGKFRFTSPTHTILAFAQALKELEAEGGIKARYNRYQENNDKLIEQMKAIGFETYIQNHQGPFITSFKYPTSSFDFDKFYHYLKANGYVIYPGKLTVDCFRIGNIGEIYLEDVESLTNIIKKYMEENK